MNTNKSGLTLYNKQYSKFLFEGFFKAEKNKRNLQHINYTIGLTHDGISLVNEHSNSISDKELMLVKDFCDAYDYSFSCYTNNTKDTGIVITDPSSQSGYGGVAIEINICK